MKKIIPGQAFDRHEQERTVQFMRKAISLTLLAALLTPALTGCTAGAETYMGEAEGYGGTLRVSVTVNGEDVTSVKVVEHSETPGVGTRAIDALPALIEQADHVGVDSVSGATVTSEAIKSAVSQALNSAGVTQQVIPMDGANAEKADASSARMGVGMASTGRVGPGTDEDGNQVYAFNVVFACGEFEEDGVIRAIKVDQLEVVSPNKGSGNVFPGFPESAEDEADFLAQVETWQTKGMLGESYMMTSGSWRQQMDAYEQMMVGKTVDEVKTWYLESKAGADAGSEAAPADTEEAAPTVAMDGTTSATMSLQDEHGDILLAIERAWEDAKNRGSSGTGTMVDTNTVTDDTQGEPEMG